MTTATGTNGNDVIGGSASSDTLSGGNGSDSLSGGSGNDVLSGGNGGDTLSGGGGNDVLIGGNDGDTLNGGEGADTIIGGNGDDMLYLDEFDKVVDGQNGFDTLFFTHTGQTLDLTSNTGIAGIEAIQMLDGGYNSLTLSAADIVRISDNDSLIINGDETSSVTFTDEGWALASVDADGSATFSNGTMQIRLAGVIRVGGVSGNATIGAPTNTDVTEDSSDTNTLSVSGTIPVSDPEAWSALMSVQVQPAADALGILMLAPDGTYRGTSSGQYTYYVNNAAVQYLGEGIVHTDYFRVTALDGTTAVVSFNITGVNDAAQVSGTTLASVAEDSNVNDGKLLASFSLSVTDADAGEAAFDYAIGDVVQSAGNLGTLTYAGNGVFNYSVDNSEVQFLNEGVVRKERFDIVTLDGTIQTVQVNIQGKDDPLTVTLPSQILSMIEDSTDPASPGNLTASCQLIINDPDAIPGQLGGTQTFIMIDGTAGYVQVQPDGTVSAVVANSAVQYLGEGEKLVVGSDVYDADFNLVGYVSFEIVGKNDPAVIDISGLNTQLQEDTNLQLSALHTSGKITIADADQGETGIVPVFFMFTDKGGVGRIDADGSIEYAISNESVQYLREGETMTDRMNVTSLDGTVNPIVFTITGTNDAPTLVPGTTQGSVAAYGSDSGTTATSHVISGNFQVGDLDVGDALSIQITALGSGYIGSLSAASLVSNGAAQQASWLFTVDDAAIVNLGLGTDLTQSYQISVADPYSSASTTMQVDIHITGGDIFVWHGTGYVGPYIGLSTLVTNRGDHITGSTRPITALMGGYGDDWLQGSAYADIMNGGLGDDRLEGNGGSDKLYGWRGNNQLFGGDGDDTLVGEWGGDNFLIGGAGQDTFVSIRTPGLSNSVTVLDFNPAEDHLQIQLNGYNASSSLVTLDAVQHIYELHTQYTYADVNGESSIDSVSMYFVGVALTEAQVLANLSYV